MKRIGKYPIVTTIAIVSGCGGGGMEPGAPPPTSEEYVVYKDNSNGHVVLDGAGTEFAVKSRNQKLLHLASGSELNGLLVASNGDISRNGGKIAAIVLVAGKNGKTIASLACTGPEPNYGAMTITVTSQGWTYRCASNTGGGGDGGSTGGEGGSGGGGGSGEGGGSGGGTENTSGRNADHCVKLAPHQFGGIGITNTCNFTIEYNYCNLLAASKVTLFQCNARPHSPSPTGYIYGQGSSSLRPGTTRQILETAGVQNQRTWVKACVSPDLPFISGFNTSTISGNSLAFGYCSGSVK